MIKQYFSIFLIFTLTIFAEKAFAGGAVTKRQQAAQQMRARQEMIIRQQIQAQQQAVIKQRVEQQARVHAQAVAQRQAQQQAIVQQHRVQQTAAQAAAMTAQHQAQIAARQAALARQQIAQRGVSGGLVVEQVMAPSVAKELGEAIFEQQRENEQVQEITTLDDMMSSLDSSSQAWPLMIDTEAKEMVVQQYIDRYRQKGVLIRKPAGYYTQMIDGMSAQAPEMLERPFSQILETAAIIEYDFDNGHNKDAMARQILGSEQAFEKNKQRLGIREK